MSYFYHDDEEDYYHGGSGLQGLKSTFESGKEKFTIDDDDEDESPQFAGSFQYKKAYEGVQPKEKTKTKISLREAFGGNVQSYDESESEEVWSDDEEDIFGGNDSDSDLSDDDIKTVKKKLNNVKPKSLNRYKKLQDVKYSEDEEDEELHEQYEHVEEYGGCEDFPKLDPFFNDEMDESDGLSLVKNPFDW